MKLTSTLLLTGVLTLAACNQDSYQKTANSSSAKILNGTDVTQLFLNKYNGHFVEPDFNESMTIYPDGTFKRIEVRQVGGGKNSQVPYPTVCSYMMVGKIDAVEKRNLADRSEYMDFATHVIEIAFDDLTLIDSLERSTTSNLNCKIFLSEMKSYINKSGSLQHSYYSELLSDDSFRIHTSGGGDYKQGGERTPTTLDEVYTKVRP